MFLEENITCGNPSHKFIQPFHFTLLECSCSRTNESFAVLCSWSSSEMSPFPSPPLPSPFFPFPFFSFPLPFSFPFRFLLSPSHIHYPLSFCFPGLSVLLCVKFGGRGHQIWQCCLKSWPRSEWGMTHSPAFVTSRTTESCSVGKRLFQ